MSENWKNYLGDKTWPNNFEEQVDKYGYNNNPRFTKLPSSEVVHTPCGHWHKEKVATPISPKVYVCDELRTKTIVWNENYSFSFEFTSLGRAISIYDNEVYTLGYNAPVAVYSLDGTFQRFIGSYGTGVGQFREARDIDIFNRLVYIADIYNNKIHIFDTNGIFISSFNTWHKLGGQWGEAKGVVVYGSKIYGLVGWRVHIYDLAGTYLSYFRGSGGEIGPHTGDDDLWLAYRGQVYNGKLYLLNSYEFDFKISIWSLAGVFDSKIPLVGAGTAEGMFIYDDKIFIVFYSNGWIVRVYSMSGILLDTFGSNGSGSGEFIKPLDIYVYP